MGKEISDTSQQKVPVPYILLIFDFQIKHNQCNASVAYWLKYY